jgi:hypothetical protein
VTKFCSTPELFVMPAPLKLKVKPGLGLIVNALAPGLKTIPFTSVLADTLTPVRLLVANVAVSDCAFGTVFGVQFVAVFQFPDAGLVFHVALPAWLMLTDEKSSMVAARSSNRD